MSREDGENVFWTLSFDIPPPTLWTRLRRRMKGLCNSYVPRDRFGYGPHLCEEPRGHLGPHGMGPKWESDDGRIKRPHYSEWSP